MRPCFNLFEYPIFIVQKKDTSYWIRSSENRFHVISQIWGNISKMCIAIFFRDTHRSANRTKYYILHSLRFNICIFVHFHFRSYFRMLKMDSNLHLTDHNDKVTNEEWCVFISHQNLLVLVFVCLKVFSSLSAYIVEFCLLGKQNLPINDILDVLNPSDSKNRKHTLSEQSKDTTIKNTEQQLDSNVNKDNKGIRTTSKPGKNI